MNQELFFGRWKQLQEPPRSGRNQGQLLRLLSAIDVGWSIEEPVIQRRRWGTSGNPLYHFILVQPHSGKRRLLSLPVSKELRGYLHREGVQAK